MSSEFFNWAPDQETANNCLALVARCGSRMLRAGTTGVSSTYSAYRRRVTPMQSAWILTFKAEGLSYAEIAAGVSVAKGTVAKVLWRHRRLPEWRKAA